MASEPGQSIYFLRHFPRNNLKPRCISMPIIGYLLDKYHIHTRNAIHYNAIPSYTALVFAMLWRKSPAGHGFEAFGLASITRLPEAPDVGRFYRWRWRAEN
jgi:hypothetical protein